MRTVEELYCVNSELRLAINAPCLYREQMADALSVVRAHQPPANFQAHRDGLRQLEAEAGLYREPELACKFPRTPTDWTDAFCGCVGSRRKAGDA